ncbi:MAG: hypothetical protein ABGX23_05890 [Nautiliaceae bacterium]
MKNPIFLAISAILMVLIVQFTSNISVQYIKDELNFTKKTLIKIENFKNYISSAINNKSLSPQDKFKAGKYLGPVENATEDAINAINLYMTIIKKLSSALKINQDKIVGAIVILFALLTIFVQTLFTKRLLFLFLVAISIIPLSFFIDYFINQFYFNPQIKEYLKEIENFVIKGDSKTIIDMFTTSTTQAVGALLGLSKTFIIKAAIDFLVVPLILIFILKKIF